MQSTVRDRKTGQYRQIVPRTAAKKTAGEAHRETSVIAENLRILAGRYRDTLGALADFMGITVRTLYSRLERPWEFRLEELEAAAMRYDVTVRQLMMPMRFEED